MNHSLLVMLEILLSFFSFLFPFLTDTDQEQRSNAEETWAFFSDRIPELKIELTLNLLFLKIRILFPSWLHCSLKRLS